MLRPVTAENLPAAQSPHAVPRPVAVEKVPASQGEQLTASGAPVVSRLRPALHAVHAVFFPEVAYWPAGQFSHSVPRPVTVENVPAAQLSQLAAAEAPVVVKYRPASHGVHEAPRGVVEYFPAGQLTHAVKSGLE